MKFSLTGAGTETVVLSAGLGGAAAFWKPQLAALEQHFRVLAFDHRGTGANAEALPEPYSIGLMADDVVAVMGAAGVARAHLMGHALGGLVGLDLARRHPTRVGKLVLVNAWARVDPHSERCFDIRLGILHTQGPAAYVAAQPLFLHTAPYMAANAGKMAAEIAHGTAHFQGVDNLLRRIGALRAFDATVDLTGITANTLVVAARDDLLVPWTASRDLAAGLPHGKIWLMEHGAHACCVEHPDAFNAKVLEFLTG